MPAQAARRSWRWPPGWPAGPAEVPHVDQRQFGSRAIVGGYDWALLNRYPFRSYYGDDRRLFGEPFYTPTPQPLGHIQIQTSPTHWETHPIYPAPPADEPPPTIDTPAAVTRPTLPPGAREF